MSSEFQSGDRFPAYPTREQSPVLARWIGCQRFIYNGKVGEDKLFSAQRRMLLRDEPEAEIRTPLDNSYAQFKDAELSPFLSEVPSQVLRQGVCRWRDAKQRQLAGLAKAPRKRNRRDFYTLRLDSDMFEFREEVNARTGEVKQALYIGGAGKFALGRLEFKAHRPFGIPKMLTITRAGYDWFVSFSYVVKTEAILRAPHELAYELDLLDDEALAAATLGLDRNVKDNAFAASNGKLYLPEYKVLQRIERKRRRTQRYQRAYARKKKGSNNQVRARLKVAQSRQYEANVLRDFAHQTSHEITSDESVRVIGLEALKLANMVRRPKPKRDEASGKWLSNGAAAKAALNQLLLGRALGRTAQYIKYKAARANKLVVEVPPQYSSQECSRCGHTHPDNRHEQRFVCTSCGFATHADLNAAAVVKKRAIARLRSGELQAAPAAPKRVSVRRKPKEGAGCSG